MSIRYRSQRQREVWTTHVQDQVPGVLQWLFPKLPQSPVPHLRVVCKVPSSEEKELINSAIHAAEEEIADVQTKLRFHILKQLPYGGLIRHSRLQRFVLEHKELLSPIHCLPDEILEKIFTFYWGPRTYELGYDEATHRPQTVTKRKYPWTLSHICGRWRTLVFSMPRLWNCPPTITSRPSYRLQNHMHHLEQTVGHCKISDDYPPDIHLRFDNRVFTSGVIRTILPNAQNWRTIRIHFQNLRHVPELDLCRLDSLEVLVVRFVETSSSVASDFLNTICARAPQLRELTVMGKDFPTLQLPWGKLTSYTQCSVAKGIGRPARERQILPLEASLRSLNLSGREFPILRPVGILTELRVLKLNLELSDEYDVEKNLEDLKLPSLEELWIIIQVRHRKLEFNAIRRIIASFDCGNLQKLVFNGVNADEAGLHALLLSVPELRELNVDIHISFWAFGLNAEAQPSPGLRNLALQIPWRGLIQQQSNFYANYIRRLAQQRCDVPTSTQSTIPTEPLDSLHLVFTDREDCRCSLNILNDWGRVSEEDQQEKALYEQFCRWSNILETYLSAFKTGGQYTADALPAVWEEMEKLDGEDLVHLRPLLLSGLISSLHALSQPHMVFNMQTVDESVQYTPFSSRADALQTKWRPLLTECLEKYPGRRWAMVGPIWLVYLSQEAVRRDPFIVFHGLEEGQRERNTLWPTATPTTIPT